METVEVSCPHCGENINAPGEMRGEIVACPMCEADMTLPTETLEMEVLPPPPQNYLIPPSMIPPVRKTSGVQCQHCKGEMVSATKVDSSIALQLLGVLVFIFGFGLLFMFPFGTIIGLVLMAAAMKLGYKKTPIWKCGACDSFFERAK